MPEAAGNHKKASQERDPRVKVGGLAMGNNMKKILLGLSAVLCLASGSARAQFGSVFVNDIFTDATDITGDLMDTLLPGVTNIRLGLGPVIATTFEGDDHYSVHAAPLISLRYKDLVQVDNNQIRVNLLGDDGAMWASENFRAGPMMKIDFGRSESDSTDLTGLGSVGTSIEMGIFASYTMGPTRYRVRVRQDVAGGHKGLLTDLDASLAIYRSKSLTVGSRIGTTWASRKYMTSFFGVNATQATASGLPVYAVGSGLKDVTLSIGGEFRVTQRLALVMNGGYERLLSKAKNAPLVRLRGSADQLSAGAYLAYAF